GLPVRQRTLGVGHPQPEPGQGDVADGDGTGGEVHLAAPGGRVEAGRQRRAVGEVEHRRRWWWWWWWWWRRRCGGVRGYREGDRGQAGAQQSDDDACWFQDCRLWCPDPVC